MLDKFWDCKYSEYDEIYDAETNEEEQIFICLKQNDCSDCENCKNFEEVR